MSFLLIEEVYFPKKLLNYISFDQEFVFSDSKINDIINTHMKRYFTLLLFTCFYAYANGQVLLEANYAATKTKDEINEEFGIDLAVYDVALYQVTYLTPNFAGVLDTASGLFCLPVAPDLYFPIASVSHGTLNDRNNAPSALDGQYQLGYVCASFGFAGAMADLLGVGISKGPQNYIHTETTASATIDLMRALREFDEMSDEIQLTKQTFIYGYSQGGHSAMATHKIIEERFADEFQVTASAPMSGPYSVSEKMIDFTLGDEPYGFSAYLAQVSLSMKAAYPEILADYGIENIFRDQYHEDVFAFEAEEIDLGELRQRLDNKLIADHGDLFCRELMKPEALEGIKTPGHPLNEVLALQDNYDWTPKNLMRIYYCEADEQVTYENAILAEETMIANGSTTVEALSMGADNNHGGCVAPSLTNAFFWWMSLRNSVFVSSNENLNKEIPTIIAGSNVVSESLLVSIIDQHLDDSSLLNIYNTNGQLMYTNTQPQTQFNIDVAHFTSGVYYISFVGNNQVLKTEKFIKQ